MSHRSRDNDRGPEGPDGGFPGEGAEGMEDADGEGESVPRAGRRARGRRTRMVRGVAWGAASVVLLSGAAAGYVYTKFNHNIAGVDIDAALGGDRPADTADGSLDLLVLGSDSRSGKNARYGRQGEGEPRSDTAMVVHLHKGRERASVVSIPRDTLVSRPACRRPDGATAPPGRREMFNTAYATGGPACAVKTVEAMTGIRMDHYLEVDFTGFRRLIDDLGGVQITTREPLRDKDAHLNLSPGTHTLNGEQALGLVRTRKAVGDGSDLGRIQLQHLFVRALVSQVQEVGLFDNPGRLYRLADTATSALTTDKRLASVRALVGLGKRLQALDRDRLTMATLPVAYDPRQPSRVVPMKQRSDQVWRALRHDRPIPGEALRDTASDETDIGDAVEGGRRRGATS